MRFQNPLRRFDWSLRSCGFRGHVTYRPTETELADRLRVETPVGVAWRCLRCEMFVPGPPSATGRADNAPIVLRGRALKDATILRVLATERFLRGLFLLVLAYGIHRFNGAKDSLQRTLDQDLPLLKPLGDKVGVDFEKSGPVTFAKRLLDYDHSTLTWITLAITAYGLLQLVEGTGLWLLKRWGEYVAVVATAAFIPLETYELVEGASFLKLFAFVVNVAAVVYLVHSKRLFGVRGGHAAFEAERHGASLLEVERASIGGPKQRDVDLAARATRAALVDRRPAGATGLTVGLGRRRATGVATLVVDPRPDAPVLPDSVPASAVDPAPFDPAPFDPAPFDSALDAPEATDDHTDSKTGVS